jgi:hypothetical protein
MVRRNQIGCSKILANLLHELIKSAANVMPPIPAPTMRTRMSSVLSWGQRSGARG